MNSDPATLGAASDATAERLRTIAAAAAPAVRARTDLAETVLRRARVQRRRRRLAKAAVGAGGGLVVLTTLAAANLLGRSDYFTVIQPSGSMKPVVQIGQPVVFNKALSPARSDVVYVHLIRDGDEYDAMMRVAAVAGDTIGCPAGPSGHCDAIVLNGTVRVEPYLGEAVMEPFPTSTVPAGAIFLLGDDREAARDSRYIGPVNLADVQGVAVRLRGPDGQSWRVPGAPAHPGPGGRDDVDPAGPLPPAKAVPAPTPGQ